MEARMMSLMCGRDIRHFAEQRVSQNLFLCAALATNGEEHHAQIRVSLGLLLLVFPTEHGCEQKSRLVVAFAKKTFPHEAQARSSLATRRAAPAAVLAHGREQARCVALRGRNMVWQHAHSMSFKVFCGNVVPLRREHLVRACANKHAALMRNAHEVLGQTPCRCRKHTTRDKCA
jgi:hypothetical protein